VGESWQDEVRFRFDLKHSVVLWGVLRGQASLFLPFFVFAGRPMYVFFFLLGLFGVILQVYLLLIIGFKFHIQKFLAGNVER
jgi:hypothetical protein